MTEATFCLQDAERDLQASPPPPLACNHLGNHIDMDDWRSVCAHCASCRSSWMSDGPVNSTGTEPSSAQHVKKEA